jgi:hypothetical protein
LIYEHGRIQKIRGKSIKAKGKRRKTRSLGISNIEQGTPNVEVQVLALP